VVNVLVWQERAPELLFHDVPVFEYPEGLADAVRATDLSISMRSDVGTIEPPNAATLSGGPTTRSQGGTSPPQLLLVVATAIAPGVDADVAVFDSASATRRLVAMPVLIAALAQLPCLVVDGAFAIRG
jgi:hypothetical protein